MSDDEEDPFAAMEAMLAGDDGGDEGAGEWGTHACDVTEAKLRDARRNNKGSQPANQAAASNGAIDMRAMYCDNQMDEATRLKFMAELKSFDPELPDAGA